MKHYKTYFNWSSGKDSALALYYLLQSKSYSVTCLLTSINERHQRVTMHGLRSELLCRQIEAIGIKNERVLLPEQPDHATYETTMLEKVSFLKSQGFTHAAFGDIFLEDLRKYREEQLRKQNIECVFPLWKQNTRDLLSQFIRLGFKAVVVCVNASLLDKSFAGRVIDEDFLNDLPKGVDPCGENGEFHTFCYHAPYFRYPVSFKTGETVLKTYAHGELKSSFWFCDLLP
jgi:uncharacterized protein (TIGR00290 family)